MIVPDKFCYGDVTISDKWIICNNFKKDLDITRDVLNDLFPEYVFDYDELLIGNSAHLYNILVCKREIFENYCEWLFKILLELEKRIDMTDYDGTQRRFHGLIAENLLDVYCDHNKFKRYYCRLLETEVDKKTQKKNALRRLRDRIFSVDKWR